MVIGMLAPAAATQAAPFPDHLNFAYELAVHYWGQEPSACATIDKEVVPQGGLGTLEGAPIAGLATQVPPQVPAGSVDCVLWIDRSYAQPVVFSGLCAVMVHEVGHLLGMAHSPDPASVMNETPAIPGLCTSKGRALIRVLTLERRLHQLQLRVGPRISELRVQTERALSNEGRQFWAIGKP